MEIYGFNGRKKKRRLWLIPVCAAAAALAGILILGIILNVNNAERDTINEAVKENTQLKRQIEDLNAQIADLQTENNSLREQLDARPTVAPSPAATPVSSANSSGKTTPRG